MKILYIGDIMGEVGIETVELVLPDLISDKGVDLVVAQGENVTQGKGISPEDYNRLKRAGVDFFTAGNWTLHRPEIWPLLKDPNEPIIRPANYLDTDPGLGYKFIEKNGYRVLVVSLLGDIVGKDADKPMNNPLKTIDKILDAIKDENKDAVVINLHGDFSSQKVIIGHYLDGRVSLVVGDHWHVPTADARVLDKGTAHITDVGMSGILDASLGVTLDSVIPRWRDGIQTRNILQTSGKKQFNSVLVDVNEQRLAKSIEQVQLYLD
jgi:metallophosphoesterase (TIGR00282 family)